MKRTLRLMTALCALAVASLASPAFAQHLEWTESFYGTAVVDKQGNAYLYQGSFLTGVWNCVKYDSNGNQLWAKSVPDPYRKLKVDHAGNLYFLGTIQKPYPFNYASNIVLQKCDPQGNLLWERTYTQTHDTYVHGEAPVSLQVDSNGNIYLLGSSTYELPNFTTLNDFMLLKYDSNGSLLWSRYYNRTKTDYDVPLFLGLDAAGNVYASGMNARFLYNIVTVKYDPNGNLLWSNRFNALSGLSAVERAATVDASGNVYVVGKFWIDGNFDYLTIKYDTNGNFLWGHRYNGLAGMDDEGAAVAVDSAGNVCVTGSSNTHEGVDIVTIKYDKDGHWLWGHRFGHPLYRDVYGASIAVDTSGNIFVGGYAVQDFYYTQVGLTIKYDKNGNWLWGRSFPVYQESSLTTDADGDVYVAGSVYGNGALLKYGSTP